jgi:hypothetical protein
MGWPKMATNRIKKKAQEEKNLNPQVLTVSDVSPHSNALYEAGKSLLIDSITTAREFCKSMIGISTGAIPLYLGILSYLLPKDYVLGINAGITITLPAVGFLVAAVIFVGGYLPITSKFSLDIIEEIEAERDKIIKHRNKFVFAGLVVFMLSTLAAIYSVIINIGVR